MDYSVVIGHAAGYGNTSGTIGGKGMVIIGESAAYQYVDCETQLS